MTQLQDIFEGDGLLARAVPAYRPRPAQWEMATRVAGALEDFHHLVVEAGTGTGKTFAYLVPALLSGRKIVISTGTRSLQDQLFQRDLPMVASAMGRPVTVALLKGRANYLCLHRLVLAEESGRYSRKGPDTDLVQVMNWARETSYGDIAELEAVGERSLVWPQVTSTTENCLGQRCDHYQRCFVAQARREAQEADIVIVNHHLLLADLALKEDGFGELLPGVDGVIVDEAHQFADIAAEFFGIALSSRQIQSLAHDSLAEVLQATGSTAALEEVLAALEKARRDARLTLGRGTGRVEWETLGSAGVTAMDMLGETLEGTLLALEGLAEASAGLANCERRARVLAERLADLEESGDRGLRWADLSRSGFTLRLTPFDVADRLRQFLYGRPSAWVFTSATLAVGDDFEHFCGRIGLDDPDSVRLESPFDYRNNGLLFLPPGLPDPGSAEYTRAFVEQALPVLEASQGGAFLLFTSHRSLREAADLLEERWDGGEGSPLLVQGTAPRDKLLVRFRAAGDAVLLGTASFWEGVDVRGPALRVVIIDKLPFTSPGDPVLKARIEAIRRAGGNPFRDHQLPEAVLALKQGVGRLIRDVDDRGVVVICDPRLRTRGYGRVFLSSLPPMPVTDTVEDVDSFFAGGRNRAARGFA